MRHHTWRQLRRANIWAGHVHFAAISSYDYAALSGNDYSAPDERGTLMNIFH